MENRYERNPDQKDAFDLMREVYEQQIIEINTLKKRVYDLELAQGILELSGLDKQKKEPPAPKPIAHIVKEVDPENPFPNKSVQEVKPLEQKPEKKKIKLNKWVWIFLIIILLVGYLYVAQMLGWTCAFTR